MISKFKSSIWNSKFVTGQSLREIPIVSLRTTPTLRRGSEAISQGLLRRYAPRNDTFHRLPLFVGRLPKFLILTYIFSFFIFHFSFICYAQPISSVELINNAKQYDGKIVVYQGEVIGDIMKRGEFAWVNVHDGVNAIGIWLDKSLLKGIVWTGSYKSFGDVIEIEGIFHNRCLEHGGDLDIHAQSMRKIKDGGLIQEKLDINKINLAVYLTGVLCLVLILNRLKRR